MKLASRHDQAGVAGLTGKGGIGKVNTSNRRVGSADSFHRVVLTAVDQDDLVAVGDLLVDQGADGSLDDCRVVLGDDDSGHGDRLGGLRRGSEHVGEPLSRPEQDGDIGSTLLPRLDQCRCLEQPAIVLLVFGVWIGECVLVEALDPPLLREAPEVLDAKRGLKPTRPTDPLRDGDEMESTSRQRLGGVIAVEEPEHPHSAGVVMVLVLDHPEDLEAVGEPRTSVGFQEGPERSPVQLVETLIGIEEQQPFGAGVDRCIHQSLPVVAVVPSDVAGSRRVGQRRGDQAALFEDLSRTVGRSVVERDDIVSKLRNVAKPLVQLPLTIANGNEDG